MNETEIENKILQYVYNFWETHSGNTIYALFSEIPEIDKDYLRRIAEKLEEDKLIEGVGTGVSCRITPDGIIETEKRELILIDKVKRYEDIRYKILEAASEAYELEGRYGTFSSSVLIEKHKINKFEFDRNARFLNDSGLIEGEAVGAYTSTSYGREKFKLLERQHFFSKEFTRISELTPQTRGIELQRLISKVLEYVGWQQEEGVKTSYEEVDIIIHQNREFYLIECKWEKEPIGTPAVTHLRDKLNRRMGTNGILMSMSGFAKTSCQNIEESTGQNLILLFGKEDIEELISNPNSFEDLLNEKYKELVTRRKVVWK